MCEYKQGWVSQFSRNQSMFNQVGYTELLTCRINSYLKHTWSLRVVELDEGNVYGSVLGDGLNQYCNQFQGGGGDTYCPDVNLRFKQPRVAIDRMVPRAIIVYSWT